MRIFFFGNFIHCDNEHTQNVTLIYTSFMRKTVEKGMKIPIFYENIESGVDVHTETLWMNRFACEKLDVLM